ncbi:MAG: serine hydrolase domain-containing protein [Gemmatimonadota bacterium]
MGFRIRAIQPVSRVLVALTLVAAGPALAQTAPDLTKQIRDSVEAWRGRLQPTGLVVGVYRHGSVVFAEGFGVRRLGSSEPVTTRTVFHLASVTKPFVATAVMQLVEKGKVDIDQPVTRYLPYFRIKDPRATGITVKQLLNHTAGMPDVTDYHWGSPESDGGALERWVRGLADSALIFQPGERWQYSNIGFEVLADLVAKVSGEPFEDYIQRHILTPLGMRHSTLLMTDVDSANLATGHVRPKAGEVVPSAVYPYNRRHAASSTLHSNIEDMLRWAAANVQKGELDGHRILSTASIDRMWTVTYDMSADIAQRMARGGRTPPYQSTGIGLGWWAYQLGDRRLIGHGGGDTGFRSTILLSPADSSAVVIMFNDERGDPSELARTMYSILGKASSH